MIKANRAYLLVLMFLFMHMNVNHSQASTNADLISIETKHGVQFNESILIEGYAFAKPSLMNINWSISQPSVSGEIWEEIESGQLFSTVIPLHSEQWTWMIELVNWNISCTCILEIAAEYHGIEQVEKVAFFAGSGAKVPALVLDSEPKFRIATSVEVTSYPIIHEFDINESAISFRWCEAPTGACSEDMTESYANLSYKRGIEYSFIIDAIELGLSDGIYLFHISVIDAALRSSPYVPLEVSIDMNSPVIIMDYDEDIEEDDMLIIDASASSDGFWQHDLQVNWYILSPQSTQLVGASTEDYEGLVFAKNVSTTGTWQITVEVIDAMGNSVTDVALINVSNKPPSGNLTINGIIPDQNVQTMQHDDAWIFEAINLVDSSSDLSLIDIAWYVNGEVESNEPAYVLNSSNFSSGVHDIKLVIMDDDGEQHAINLTIEIQSAPSIESSNNTSIVYILVSSLILMFGIFIWRIRERKNKSSLTKWNEDVKKDS